MTDQEKKELAVSEKKTVDAESGEPTREGLTYVPHVDIAEDAESITLRADLPGVKKDAVEIDVREGILTLNAVVEPVPETWDPVYGEYPVGGFARRFSLSEKIDPANISASMEHGVLTLVMPKAAAHQPRKIEIR